MAGGTESDGCATLDDGGNDENVCPLDDDEGLSCTLSFVAAERA